MSNSDWRNVRASATTCYRCRPWAETWHFLCGSPSRDSRSAGGSMTRLAMILLFAAAASLGAQAQGGTGDDVPTTHRPPPGMCRIWIDGVPAGRQPAPTDCATAIRRRPPNARVIFGDEVRMQRGGEPRLPQAHAEEPRMEAGKQARLPQNSTGLRWSRRYFYFRRRTARPRHGELVSRCRNLHSGRLRPHRNFAGNFVELQSAGSFRQRRAIGFQCSSEAGRRRRIAGARAFRFQRVLEQTRRDRQ